VKAGERREEQLGDNLLDEMRRVQCKAWELVAKTESEGDHRGAIVALREVRECLESLGEMLARVQSPAGRPNLGRVLEAAKRRVENMAVTTELSQIDPSDSFAAIPRAKGPSHAERHPSFLPDDGQSGSWETQIRVADHPESSRSGVTHNPGTTKCAEVHSSWGN